MATVKEIAREFIGSYGTVDSKTVNDCYSIFNGSGKNILRAFMHNSVSIKNAFTINDLGRNEDIKLKEAEIISSNLSYDVFDRFGLDLIICENAVGIYVTKPGVKNSGPKFSMHNQIFNPSNVSLDLVLSSISEDSFFEISKIKKTAVEPDPWYYSECEEKNFVVSESSEISIDYGYSVMGKTTSYWREHLDKEKLLSFKIKSVPDPSARTNRLLSAPILKAIQIGSEISPERSIVLSSYQTYDDDLKTQYRISFLGCFEESASSRTFQVNTADKTRYICFYAKTVVDRVNERTTLIVKMVTKTVKREEGSSKISSIPADAKMVVASFGITKPKSGDPNYNQMIVKEILRSHTNLALKISSKLNTPVIVYKMQIPELTNHSLESEGRILNYQKDSADNIYFLSKTLEVLPKSLSTIIYLGGMVPTYWIESFENQSFYVTCTEIK